MRLLPDKLLRGAVPFIALFLAACGGGGGAGNGTTPAPAAIYSVGGTLTGLLSTNSITLVNNGADVLTLNGASNVGQTQTFAFATKLNYGASYSVAVSGVAPATQPCTSTYGAGMLAYADNVPGYYLPGVNLFCGLTGGANAFTQSSNLMNAARYNHTATLLPSGLVLDVGGTGTAAATSSAELYGPSVAWTYTAQMTVPRYNHAATLLANGQVLISGGQATSGGVIADAELYTPPAGVVSGSWTRINSMNVPRRNHTATLLPNGKVLVSGGYNGISSVASAELYDPAFGTWTPTGPMNVPRQYHTATLLPNGKVLVAGGTGTVAAPSSAELYDPATGIWLNTCNLTTGRYNHTATLLPNGKVLVSGGQQISAIVTATAELYDRANCSGPAGSWSGTGALTTARYNHTATLLQNGKVLVSGGNNGTAALDSAELYY